jgi:hypothetical protein
MNIFRLQQKHSIETRVKEHQQKIRLEHQDKSAKAKQTLSLGHLQDNRPTH